MNESSIIPADRPQGPVVVSPQAFDEHCRGGRVLASKDDAPAVLAHDNPGGRRLITKIWWPQGLLGERSLRYSDRFRRALLSLESLDVAVPALRGYGRVRGGARFVVYEELPGTTLRELSGAVDLEALAEFVVGLHARGVYFRGLHLGNVIRRPDGGFGLIDVQDVRFRPRPLGLRMRERNLGILCSHPRDLSYMLDGHWSELVLAYCRRAGMNVSQAARLRDRVDVQVQRRRAKRSARRARRGLAPLEF